MAAPPAFTQLGLWQCSGTKQLLLPKDQGPALRHCFPTNLWASAISPCGPSTCIPGNRCGRSSRVRLAHVAMPPQQTRHQKRLDKRLSFSQTERHKSWLYGRWVTMSITIDPNSKDWTFKKNCGKIRFSILNNTTIKLDLCHNAKNLFDYSHLSLRKKSDSLPTIFKLFLN